MVVARRYVISGLVHGVGYRFFVQAAAEREGLGGFVRNRQDGCVELRAEGEQAGLDRFERTLHQGPPRSIVDHVEVDQLVPEGRPPVFRIDIA